MNTDVLAVLFAQAAPDYIFARFCTSKPTISAVVSPETFDHAHIASFAHFPT